MRRLLVIALLPATSAVAGPAAASCSPPGPLPDRLAQAPVVFVGRVLSTTNRDRVAQVRVEEVWKGPDLPDEVEVRGTSVPATENVATSVDRTFRTGTRYLFVPSVPGSAVVPGRDGAVGFQDGLCTATQEHRAELDRLRPASAGPADPISTGGPARDEDGSGLALPFSSALASAFAVASLGSLWALRRRNRAPRSTDPPTPPMPG